MTSTPGEQPTGHRGVWRHVYGHVYGACRTENGPCGVRDMDISAITFEVGVEKQMSEALRPAGQAKLFLIVLRPCPAMHSLHESWILRQFRTRAV